MNRRAMCGRVGAGLGLLLSGCLSSDRSNDEGTTNESDDEPALVPEACPVTQDLGVEPPVSMTEGWVGSYVEAYERAYVDEIVVGDDDTVDTAPSSTVRTVSADDPGFVVEVETVWSRSWAEGVLVIAELTETVPDGITPIEADDLGGPAELVADAAREAAADDTEVRREESGGRDAHEPILEELGPAHEEKAAENAYYVVVDDRSVRVNVGAAGELVSDDAAVATYYVDDTSVRRTTDRSANPRNGGVLECFESDAERGRIAETP